MNPVDLHLEQVIDRHVEHPRQRQECPDTGVSLLARLDQGDRRLGDSGEATEFLLG
jgi:hypothetical protein